MNITKTLVAVAIALSMTSCSDTPSPSDARAKLESDIQRQSKGLIKLISFEKTDGAVQEIMGVKSYKMNYTADIEFQEDCFWNGGGDTGGMGDPFEAFPGQQSPGLPGILRKETATKGEHQKISGRMEFEKSERGWH